MNNVLKMTTFLRCSKCGGGLSIDKTEKSFPDARGYSMETIVGVSPCENPNCPSNKPVKNTCMNCGNYKAFDGRVDYFLCFVEERPTVENKGRSACTVWEPRP